MRQGSDITWVAAVVGEVGTDGVPVVGSVIRVGGDVGSSHVQKTIGQVGRLPLPPETIQVSMVQEEDGIAWRKRRVLHLDHFQVSLRLILARDLLRLHLQYRRFQHGLLRVDFWRSTDRLLRSYPRRSTHRRIPDYPPGTW